MDSYNETQTKCPKCNKDWGIRRTRLPYCGPGDYNVTVCECGCGHKWEEID